MHAGHNHAGLNSEGVAFRHFRFFPREGRLLAGDKPIDLGARASDLLLTLVEASGMVVPRDVLMSRVWENRIVTENNLQVQVAALRNALGDDRDLIRTVTGRGYQFTGQVEALSGVSHPKPDGTEPVGPRDGVQTNLPEAVSGMIGREAELDEVVALVRSHRFVTLTGAGGIGKTRLALEAARSLQIQFPHGVWIVHVSAICDPALLPQAVAGAVGLSASADITAEEVSSMIGSREMLIILDTCEHVIDAAAAMAEALLCRSPGVRVLATSRERLDAFGEWVYRVGPLGVPSAEETEPAKFEAVLLFVERGRAMDIDFLAEERAMAVIAAICRELDGVPLAIELAAMRAASLGIYTLADRLNDRLQLLTCGRRTALPRHQTLRAMLDWSYQLLSIDERTVLGWLVNLSPSFDVDDVRDIAVETGLTPAQAIERFVSLVTKSLVSAKTADGKTSYWLPKTTRVYLLEKVPASGEYHPTTDITARENGSAADFFIRRCRSKPEPPATRLQFAA
jgi:predicted ATPase/DNA-binding winged helix-turn-helix (wHTH) protein